MTKRQAIVSPENQAQVKKNVQRYYRDFKDDLLDEILENAEMVNLKAGETLVDIGFKIEAIPLIYEGMLKVSREDEEGNEMFLYYLEPGDACAMSLGCSGREKISKVRAIAVEDTELLMIPAEKMDTWMARYKSWYHFVLETYQQRFEELLRTIEGIAFKKMDDRLIDFLRKTTEAQNSLSIQTTHQAIANELGSSREVISRLLKQLETKGMIRLGRNKIEVIDLLP
jgi:CRP/FNR family transcriptional regulator